jgi:tRNA-specific 2-thiouridylase
MTKPEVRIRAAEHGLALAAKPDSQEICFIPDGDYKRFISAYLAEQGEQLPDTAGDMVAPTGEILGHHDGIHNFTVGQRKGLGVSTANPLYVLQVDAANHRIVAGSEDELLSHTLRARNLNWISIPALTAPMRVQVKIRHRHQPAWATIIATAPDEVTAQFDEPQRAITPGQAAVFYHNDEVVGGGWII